MEQDKNLLIRDACNRHLPGNPADKLAVTKRPVITNALAALAAGDTEVGRELTINGPITDELPKLVTDYINSTPSPLRINIASKGGSLFAALQSYDAFRACNKHVVTRTNSLCASCAALLLLAGDEVEVSPNAIVLFHLPQIENLSGNAEALERNAQLLRQCETLIANIIAERTGWTQEKALAFLAEERYIGAKQALEMFLVDRVC